MADDDKKIKTNLAPTNETNPAPKKEVAANDKSTSGVDASKSGVDASKAADASKGGDASKAEGGKSADAPPSGYSRGEGQKPVSQAYKDNWNAIFAKKKKR
jgi:hypothetical protein